ncbi:DNA glycosylase [Suhomyces tanzawaensis NRRL Y-17324]|uniref:N-glycosylase/DNA lyase n=1 Tax=Suhomyces tanzawaensis NRRL Y-17324 TaxID=984487 RepID=A0A1E4SH49_9ASCO|nr:DNA glycosylase [Suhomyces tanzawaensis NRRL Y-17324]ODV78839.1 DNA glycosylase [Suhomyces tanzawaensis NRRL Y-17324]
MTVDILWKKFPIKQSELCLSKVLRCGQAFRWKNIHDVWSFAIRDRVVLLKQDEEYIHYSQLMLESSKISAADSDATLSFVEDYFSLNLDLQELYSHWQLQHSKYHHPSKVSPFDVFKGIRILHQDPWETLISFICSSNNNVKRISKMCENICVEFGEHITEYDGVSFYAFPEPERLAEPHVEARLRELGFGYRAKYIYQTACKLTGDDPELSVAKLNEMREHDYDTAHEFLLQLSGVGPKVADCICLMALEKHDVVPVDTHVYQIAIRDYKFKGKRDMKTMNKVVYKSIREHFKGIFGPYAGWAQSVLFTADLGDLKNGTNIEKTDTETEAQVKSAVKIEVKTEVQSEVEVVPSRNKRNVSPIIKMETKRVKVLS